MHTNSCLCEIFAYIGGKNCAFGQKMIGVPCAPAVRSRDHAASMYSVNGNVAMCYSYTLNTTQTVGVEYGAVDRLRAHNQMSVYTLKEQT